MATQICAPTAAVLWRGFRTSFWKVSTLRGLLSKPALFTRIATAARERQRGSGAKFVTKTDRCHSARYFGRGTGFSAGNYNFRRVLISSIYTKLRDTFIYVIDDGQVYPFARRDVCKFNIGPADYLIWLMVILIKRRPRA